MQAGRHERRRSSRPAPASERGERIVEGDEVRRRVRRRERAFVEGDLHRATAALLIPLRASRVHEDPPHEPRGHRQKVRPVLPVHMLDIDQAQVRLVDQGVA